MSERYQACLHIDRLRLPVFLGYEEAERQKAQAVELDLRFYFRKKPESCEAQTMPFLCYDQLTQVLLAYVEGKEFQLIEFLSTTLMQQIRLNVAHQLPQLAEDDIRIVMSLHKCHPPVPAIMNGVRIVISDLPDGFKVGDVL
ncbi:MAG: dihydroneopterin aldolase [Rickettsiales bacterium]|nr:dihydroneopterin aldolase [Rickettsiales bacterium]